MKRTIALLLVLLFQCEMVQAHRGFPGRGNRHAWQAAAQLFNKGVKAEIAGNTDEALKLYESARKLYPYDSDFYDNAAVLYEDRKHDFITANRLFQQGMATEPNDIHIKLRYVALLIDEGKTGDAAHWMKQLASSKAYFNAEEKQMYLKLENAMSNTNGQTR